MHLPYTLPLPPGFSLRDTLTCGQCFRWRENPDGSFTGFAGSRPAALFQQGDTLFLSDADTASGAGISIWTRTMAGGTRRSGLTPPSGRPSGSAAASASSARTPGRRSFPLSSAPTTTSPASRGLSGGCATISGRGAGSPPPGGWPGRRPRAWRRCGRASGQNTSSTPPGRWRPGKSAWIRFPPSPSRRRKRNSDGSAASAIDIRIGALLYGFHRLEAFPVDTWMKKVLARYYPEGFPAWVSPKGVAQQYLFHYIRHHG